VKINKADHTRKFNQDSIQEWKSKLDVELLGVESIETSAPKELKDRATYLLPSVKSVVVLGKEIYKEVVALLGSSKEAGEAERGELLGPHSDYLNGRLTKAIYDLTSLFRKDGYRSLPLPAAGCPTDQRSLTALFSYKHAAQLAGLGTIGRHSLLITSQFGPRIRLACLLTEAPLEASPSASGQKDYCIDCDACIRECPAQALQVPKGNMAYSINKFACRTYRQAGLTCSLCMKVCDEALG
jgi:epoxyqueuosine reductase QueG